MVAKYGKENADFIVETLGDWMKNYNKFLYLRDGRLRRGAVHRGGPQGRAARGLASSRSARGPCRCLRGSSRAPGTRFRGRARRGGGCRGPRRSSASWTQSRIKSPLRRAGPAARDEGEPYRSDQRTEIEVNAGHIGMDPAVISVQDRRRPSGKRKAVRAIRGQVASRPEPPKRPPSAVTVCVTAS